MNKKYMLFFAALVFALLMSAYDASAQCPMCRMSAESNMKAGGTAGAGLNAGILYMLVAPYLIVSGIAIWWWRNRSTRISEQLAEDINDTARMN